MDRRILSDEQKEMLRQTAKGRSRNSRGQFVDTVTAQEARIAELEKDLADAIESRNRFRNDLVAANNRERNLEAEVKKLEQANKFLKEENDGLISGLEARVARAYTEGTVMTLLISFTAAVLAFFVGRWAR